MKRTFLVLSSLVVCFSATMSLAQNAPARTPAGQLAGVIPGPTARATPQPGGGNIPLWSSSFVFNNTVFPFTMVGTNPTQAGAGTTNVPVTIIPLALVFGGSTIISPTGSACGDTINVISRTQNSPLFTTNTTWIEGSTVVGVTQFTDAFQRANFWSSVSTVSPNYHVLLNPVSVASPVMVNVPSSVGGIVGFACSGHPIGGVSINYLDSVVQNLIVNLHIPPTTLPLFLMYNIEELLSGGGAFLGYHSITSSSQTYAVGSYVDSGLLGFNVADVSILSHELGEWLDDPLGNNTVPSWGHVGQVTGCQNNLEVGDPLTGSNSTVNTGSFLYHLQDLAFFSWFARENPSRAVNGWYSTLNAFAGPPPICQ